MSFSVSRIAVLGASCRLPSVNGLADFWRVLTDEECVISEVQPDRFTKGIYEHPDRTRAGRSVSFAAGQLERPFDFDPGFFGISRREAAVMDPQQRVLLEVVQEALDHAGIPGEQLAGGHAGVYVGASSLEHSNFAQLDPAVIEPQSMTGNTLSVIANRISYIFDLRGPSYTLDTACSSSLLALHHAMEDIRSGRVETAIVGGVSMLFNPIPFIGFSRASMLSAQGLCRAFDADADGYVRSEGAVALVLRAADAAERAGDTIRAELIASGTNADGRTAGLSLPSPVAQAALLDDMYGPGKVDPARLAFVEAHGTGTPVGDPIEADAIGKVLAKGREEPLLIGSVKSNFGHLEPASGLVGVLKAQLALENDLLPASLHFDTPNPNIPFDDLNLKVVGRAQPLAPATHQSRYAGVNSFGFGGTNTHVVLADPPSAIARPKPQPAPILLSAASKDALRALAGRTAATIAAGAPVEEIANANAHRRSRLTHRAVVAPSSEEEVTAALRALESDAAHPLLATGEAIKPGAREGVVFAYSGNGSQWAGMGQKTYQSNAAFRAAFDHADKLFMSRAGWSLVSMLFSGDLESEIERTEIAQPLLFVLQVALTEALADAGVRPDVIIGHSVGEVAAAWASGALSLDDAMTVFLSRSAHQEMTRHLGGMSAVLASEETTNELIADFPGVEIAAINSPRSVTVSGPSDALTAFAAGARKRRVAVKRLPIDYPFHCSLLEPIKDDLLASLAGLSPRAAEIPMVSTVTAEPVNGTELGAQYWWQNAREAVRFAEAAAIATQMASVVVEIGPRPVLTNYVRDTARERSRAVAVIGSLTQPERDGDTVAAILGEALAAGAALDDAKVFGPASVPADVLPAYPWQHERLRLDDTEESLGAQRHDYHPLLGFAPHESDATWYNVHDSLKLPFLADHKVESAVVFPAAGFVEMLLAAGRRRNAPGATLELRNMDIIAPLVLSDAAEREVRTREVTPATFMVESRPRLSADPWTPHAKGTVTVAPSMPTFEGLVADTMSSVGHDALYQVTERFGLAYGPHFRLAERVDLSSEASGVAYLKAPTHGIDPGVFALDPTLFDATFHGLFAFLGGRGGAQPQAVLPTRVGRLILTADGGVPVKAVLRARHPVAGSVEADFGLFDSEGALVAAVRNVRFVSVPLASSVTAPVVNAVPYLKRLPRHDTVSTLSFALPDSVLSAEEVEPADDQLLIDAGVMAAAQRVLGPLFETPTAIQALVRSGRVAGSAVPLVARLLGALEGSGRAEHVSGAWVIDGDPIPLDDVIAVLVSEHQTRAGEAATIAALPELLQAALDGGLDDAATLPDTLRGPLCSDAPFAAPLFDALERMFDAAVTAQRTDDDALQLLLVGASNPQFLRRLTARIDPTRMRLTITDRDPAILDRAVVILGHQAGTGFAPFDTLEARNHPFDVLLHAPHLGAFQADGLQPLVRPGGSLLAANFAPSLFADAIGGLSAGWWDGSAEPESPVGALATEDEWRTALLGQNLEVACAGALASDLTDGVVVHARRAKATEPGQDLDTFDLYAFGSVAQKTMDALGALLPQTVPVRALGDPLEGERTVVAVSINDVCELPSTLAQMSELFADAGPSERTVWLVTFGAQGHRHSAPCPTAAAVYGFARVAANEFPHLSIRIVDLTRDFEPAVAAVRLAAELAQPNDEREIALSSDHRAAMRYAPAGRPGGGDGMALALPQRGSIDFLDWQPMVRDKPEVGQVEVAVEATGLNFRDVMWTLGLLPSEALQDGFAGATLGMECAGTVSAVGEGVTDFSVGDPVLAFAPAAFSSHVMLSASSVVRRPPHLEAEAAATVPVTFLTAYYALVELAQLEEGETVLIHGGAGGVGLAALQIAKDRGATVFATGGTPAKRALLTALGADQVFDSRSLVFADEVMAETGGEGVDVVLNSLAGEAMERSIDVLKPFGRFLELGKRDFYADTKLGLRPFRQNLSYFGIDADQLMKYRPKVAERTLRTVMDKFTDGTFTALPYRAFDAASVGDAFRLMQSANHIGKVVVRAPETVSGTAVNKAGFVDPAKQYVLVGGTSGFGFATSEWLIAEGARHLALISRSGVKDERIAAAVEAHKSAGVNIEVVQCDATQAAELTSTIETLHAARPIAGVFHTAMVLDDGLIASLDADRFQRVLGPKALALDALEVATAEIELDLFVVYSSLTVQLGNPGQANYVAANAYLEAAMSARRARGMPGLAVAWGAIGDVGVVARDDTNADLLQRKLGAFSISSAEGLGALKDLIAEGAMLEGPAVRIVGRVDWAAARKDLVLARSPAFEDLAEPTRAGANETDAEDLKAMLAGLTTAQAEAKVVELLAGEISQILKMSSSEIDPKKPLTAIGMDSLMGVELRMAAEQRLGIDIPLMSLASGATLADLAAKVVAQLGAGTQSPDQDFADQAVRHIGRDLSKDDETAAMIEQLKEKTGATRTILE